MLHKYNEPMEYSDKSMNNAVFIEKIFSEFFHNIKAILRRLSTTARQNLTMAEFTLTSVVEEIKVQVRTALMDDFDTPKAVTYLLELVKKCNKYLDECSSSSSSSNTNGAVNTVVLSSIAKYLTEMFCVFGVIQHTSNSADIGFPFETQKRSSVPSSASVVGGSGANVRICVY